MTTERELASLDNATLARMVRERDERLRSWEPVVRAASGLVRYPTRDAGWQQLLGLLHSNVFAISPELRPEQRSAKRPDPYQYESENQLSNRAPERQPEPAEVCGPAEVVEAVRELYEAAHDVCVSRDWDMGHESDGSPVASDGARLGEAVWSLRAGKIGQLRTVAEVRAEALEEAAGVCDAIAALILATAERQLCSNDRHDLQDQASIAEQCAEEIRALASDDRLADSATLAPRGKSDGGHK